MNQTLTQRQLDNVLNVLDKAFDVPNPNGGILQKGGAEISIYDIRKVIKGLIAFIGTAMITLSWDQIFHTFSDINSGNCAGATFAARSVLGLNNDWCQLYFAVTTGVAAGGMSAVFGIVVQTLMKVGGGILFTWGQAKAIESAMVRAIEAAGNRVNYYDEERPDIEGTPELEEMGEIDGGRKRSKKSRSKSKKSRSKSKKSSSKSKKSRSKSKKSRSKSKKSRSKSKKRKTSKKTRRKKR
tara:strand:+ start:6354 stop:7073 length:720 start_codon:yes stop_codon:yes gene_type:complete